MVELFLRDGTVLQNRYKVEGLISAGGSGQVYKASDIRFPGKWWTIKVFQKIPPETFNKEARRLAMAGHPHLVRVADFFTDKENQCLVAEFVNGRSLDQILDEVTVSLPERQVLSWGIQCADALLYLHEQYGPGFYYKNFSPRKILISSSSEVKLLPPLWRSLKGQGVPGVMGFAPPEVFEETEEPDDRSDLYALAAVLHRCLAGENPLDVPFVFVPLASLNTRLISSVDRVLDKATQSSLGKRYGDLQEFRKDLYRCFQEVLRVHPPSFRPAHESAGLWWIVMLLSGLSILIWLYFFV